MVANATKTRLAATPTTLRDLAMFPGDDVGRGGKTATSPTSRWKTCRNSHCRGRVRSQRKESVLVDLMFVYRACDDQRKLVVRSPAADTVVTSRLGSRSHH